jgi:ribonuclease-3
MWRKIMSDQREDKLKEFQNILGINFSNLIVLDAALTHSSYANQYGLKYNQHNERLEFLGDSVLSIIVSEYLYKKYKSKAEGKLTKIRAGVVCEASLSEIARRLKLNEYLRIGKGEEMSGGREKDSLLADACEAVIAAIYLDRGYESAQRFVLGNLHDNIERVGADLNKSDYKTRLQEHVQKDPASEIRYDVIGESGPDHDKVFKVEVFINEKSFGTGKGKSKKEAQQSAAREALICLGVDKNE